MTTQPFQWWITPTPQQTKHIPQVGWEHPTIPHHKARNHTKRVGWEYPTKFPILSTVWRELSWNNYRLNDKSFRDCHTSMYQMVGCSHPTVELDRGIGSFRWWNASTIQQIEDVRVVGWEYPTTREQQCTNNTKQPIIINDTKSVDENTRDWYMKNYHLCGGMLPPYSNLAQEMVFINKKYQMVGCSHPTSKLDRGIGSFRRWSASTIQQIKHVRVVGWEYPTTREQQDTNNIKEPNTINDTKSVGWEYPPKFPIISTVWRELSWNRNKSKDKSFRDSYTSIYQMVGCSHPTVELDRAIGSFRWWNVSTIQQIKHVRVVGWEYPTTIVQQGTDNTGQPNTINSTKSVGWEYPTKKLQIINHHYKRLKYA